MTCKNRLLSAGWSLILTFALMIISTVISFVLFRLMTNNHANISLIYILALVMVARFTEG